MRPYSLLCGGALAAWALIGCGSQPQNTTSATEGGSSTTNSGGSGNASSTTSGTGGAGHGGDGGDGGAATSATTGTGGGTSDAVLRFIALGDGGEGNTTQYKVADAVKLVCDAAGGCDFAVYLGDNFYDSGVDGVRDMQFQTKFEMPYAVLPFPFYVALGNHDYGGNGAGYEYWKAEAQIEYTMLSSKWKMPSRFYKLSAPAEAGPADGPVATFFALDTNAIMFTGDDEQLAWLNDGTSAAPAGWKIGFGHHPYVSNGAHGNAGEYEGIPFIPVVSGEQVKDFFDDAVCGKIDVYLSGHDHNRQWLEPACGTEYIVSGTAAKTTDLEGQGTPTFFEADQKGGFMLVELTAASFKGTFYDEDGVEEFTRTVTK
jgi:tartrate-resistant acid phosphatase type 5